MIQGYVNAEEAKVRRDRIREEIYGLIVTITTPWLCTSDENFSERLPVSLPAHKLRTFAVRCGGYPISVHETEISAAFGPRLNSTSARPPSANCLAQISWSPFRFTRRPCIPRGS